MPFPDIILKPLGVIHTPYKNVSDNVPIQGRMFSGSKGHIEIFSNYIEACRDLEGFSHIFLLYHFHVSVEERLVVKPYMDSVSRGVFSTRFPHRPNRIGLSLVELVNVDNGIIGIRGADMVDGSPLLDIKPYCPAFDSIDASVPVRTGWMEQYVTGGETPAITKTGSREEWLNEDGNDQ